MQTGEEETSMNGKRISEAHARMWPRELFDATEDGGKKKLARALGPTILDRPGIYILYRDDIPYYIGQAKKLRRRIGDHAWDPNSRHFNFWNFVSAFVIEDTNHRDEIEAILIAAMPTANGARPGVERKQLPPQVRDLIRDIRRSRANPKPVASSRKQLP